MSAWAAKRFWDKTEPVETEGGYTVTLDSRFVKTPAKRELILPTLAMAEAVAAEWDAQEGVIDPVSMPCTRSANAAIDKVAVQFDEVAELLGAYGDSDLTCYRAAEPEALVARQNAVWDPILDWAEVKFGARLIPSTGVIHRPQASEALEKITSPLFYLTSFELAAMHDLITLSGSLLIGWAAYHRQQPVDALWQASRIDEIWQIEHWGDDEEATELAEQKMGAFRHAARFLVLCHS